jgi:hypothetical protein
MKFADFESALSIPRLGRYTLAAGGNRAKALRLYRANIKLGQRFYGIIGMFEVVLRNAINEHFLVQYNDADWLLNQSNRGFLISFRDSVNKEYVKLNRYGHYTNDKLISSLSFGIWTYMFSNRGYRNSGKTVLQIFPARPHGLAAKQIYRELDSIRAFRNRIAHHEPLCFDKNGNVDTTEAARVLKLLTEYISYLGYTPKELLYGIESPDKTIAAINAI